MASQYVQSDSLEHGAALPALRMVSAPRAARFLAAMLAVFIVALPLALYLVPWQQNIPCSGRVVAFDPLDRKQTLQAPVSGRIVRVHVMEGSRVQKGDVLVEMEDQDPNYLSRLEQQLTAARAKLDAKREKVSVYMDQLIALEDAREMAIASARAELESAIQKVRAEEEGLVAAEAYYEQKRLDYERQSLLEEKGVVSELKAQEAERDFLSARAKVQEAKAKVASARADEEAKMASMGKVGQEAKAKIDSTKALREAARADLAVSEKELMDAEVKIERQRNQTVMAPRAGRVFRIRVAPGAEQLKQGDPLLDLIPDAQNLAVELWVDGNDAPLIQEGRPVRLQFEGWPAVQFSGWPAVAVGTFGGRVRLVDAQDDGFGRFRIVVLPDPNDEPWPDNNYLRQGVRANGWVLLDQVSAGFEIWRQLNGFPPTVAMDRPASKNGSATGKEM